MKMPKFRIAVLVLLVATIIYGVALYQSVWRYYSRLAEQKAELEETFGKVYVSTKDFFVTSEGQQFFMGGIVFVVAWLVLLNLREWKTPEQTLEEKREKFQSSGYTVTNKFTVSVKAKD